MEPVNANVGTVTTQKSHTAVKVAGVAAGVVAVGSLVYAAKKGNVKDAFEKITKDGKDKFKEGFIKDAFKRLGAGYGELGKAIKKAPGKALDFIKKHNPFGKKGTEPVENAAENAGQAAGAAIQETIEGAIGAAQ